MAMGIRDVMRGLIILVIAVMLIVILEGDIEEEEE